MSEAYLWPEGSRIRPLYDHINQQADTVIAHLDDFSEIVQSGVTAYFDDANRCLDDFFKTVQPDAKAYFDDVNQHFDSDDGYLDENGITQPSLLEHSLSCLDQYFDLTPGWLDEIEDWGEETVSALGTIASDFDDNYKPILSDIRNSESSTAKGRDGKIKGIIPYSETIRDTIQEELDGYFTSTEEDEDGYPIGVSRGWQQDYKEITDAVDNWFEGSDLVDVTLDDGTKKQVPAGIQRQWDDVVDQTPKQYRDYLHKSTGGVVKEFENTCLDTFEEEWEARFNAEASTLHKNWNTYFTDPDRALSVFRYFQRYFSQEGVSTSVPYKWKRDFETPITNEINRLTSDAAKGVTPMLNKIPGWVNKTADTYFSDLNGEVRNELAKKLGNDFYLRNAIKVSNADLWTQVYKILNDPFVVNSTTGDITQRR